MAAIAVHGQFIYPFDETPFALEGYQSAVIETPEGVAHIAETTGEGPSVMYLMGNAGALALFPRTLSLHRDAGRHVVALEYPGGGGRPGTPSETALKAQALAAYDRLAADGPAVVHGYSLGSSLALYVASQRDVAGVILDAPFARMCEQMARQSYLPACWLPGVQKWDSLALAEQITAPVMIQHGALDQLALITDGQRLFAALKAAGVDVTFHTAPQGNHTNLIDMPGYQDRIAGFIAAVMP